MDSRSQFTKTTVALHWIIALAVIGSLILGMYVEDLPRGTEKFELIGLHKSVGVLVLVVLSSCTCNFAYGGYARNPLLHRDLEHQ